MEGRRETEAHPGDVDAPSHAGGIESDVDAERLEHVGAATPAGGRPVAVLRHRDPGPSRHQRGRGRDVERARAVAAGAAGVDASRRQVEWRRMRPHRFDKPRHLLHRLAPGPERDQETGNLRRGGLTGHHLVHNGACMLPTERCALQELLDRLRGRHGLGYWYAAGVAITSSASSIR